MLLTTPVSGVNVLADWWMCFSHALKAQMCQKAPNRMEMLTLIEEVHVNFPFPQPIPFLRVPSEAEQTAP